MMCQVCLVECMYRETRPHLCCIDDSSSFRHVLQGSGYLGMKVAVYSNARTTVSAQKSGWTACFNTAFRAGAVMGFALCAAGLLMLYITMLAFRQHYPEPSEWIYLTESITGYGLGGSVIAMVSPLHTRTPHDLDGYRFLMLLLLVHVCSLDASAVVSTPR